MRRSNAIGIDDSDKWSLDPEVAGREYGRGFTINNDRMLSN
jgi:hypothetical protein